MGILILAAEAASEPDAVGVVGGTVIAAGYSLAGAGLVQGWVSGTVERTPSFEGESRIRLMSYRLASVLAAHILADLMLVLTIVVAVAGPVAGAALHSWSVGALIGAIGAPSFTAYRRLEKSADNRERAADGAENVEFTRRMEYLKLQQAQDAHTLELEERQLQIEERRLQIQKQQFEFDELVSASEDRRAALRESHKRVVGDGESAS